MGLFNIIFSRKVEELSPPDKRDDVGLAWLRSFASALEYLKNKFLVDYKKGASYPVWSAGTFNKGDIISYKQVLYECQSDGVTNEPPNEGWGKYLDSYIGVDNRILFNAYHIVLEKAINEYYQTTFRQPKLLGWSATPDATHELYSDIYLTLDAFTIDGFVIGKTESYSSTAGQTLSSGTVAPLTPFNQANNFTINIPTAVYALTNDSEIRNFVDKFNTIGILYTIIPY